MLEYLRIGEKEYAWIIDSNRIIISHPYVANIGRNAIDVCKQRNQELDVESLDNIIHKMEKTEIQLHDILSSPKQDIMQILEIEEDIADSIIDNAGPAEKTAEEIDRNEIEILLKTSPDYPVHITNILGYKKAPPVLFMQGNRQILEKKAVSFCGSRRCSETGIKKKQALLSMLPS